jgi:hypothetical protein
MGKPNDIERCSRIWAHAAAPRGNSEERSCKNTEDVMGIPGGVASEVLEHKTESNHYILFLAVKMTHS